MAVPVEEAIAALSTFSLEDEQPEVQGPGVWVSTERVATDSPIEYSDVSAYRLSLSEDTKALNQLNALIQEGKEMASVLYTYRSCVKALPQLPDSMKQSQADLYLETYQVLDLEMSRLREIQRWQASASSKLAADMQRFSRPERRINGPTISHLWSMLKLLDVLVQLDHLKNAKASIPNDFSWYKRTFTQVSGQWQDTDSMREELDDLQIFLSTRWAILLNLHVEMFRVNKRNIGKLVFLLTIPTLAHMQRPTVEVTGHKAHGAMPEPGSVVIARVTKVMARSASADIMCVGPKSVREKFTGIIRQQDVRATEIDKVEMHLSFHPGDIVRAIVLSLGDARAYYLSTAKNELGVVSAESTAGASMVPISWTEMQCPLTGQIEQRKVAKVTS